MIKTYKDLQDAVNRWMGRDDPDSLAEVKNLINFAEKEIYRNLRLPIFEKFKTFRIVSGSMPLPDDYHEFKYIWVSGLGVLNQTTVNNIGIMPKSFTVIGNNLLFSPDVASRGQASISYYAKQKELENDNDTNTLLQESPDLLLYAALKQAAVFAEDDEALNKFTGLYNGVRVQILAEKDESEYSASALQVPMFTIG